MATPLSIRARDLQARLLEGETIRLVDVREDAELALARLPMEVLHLPLSRSAEWVDQLEQLLPPQQTVAVLCHAGMRSWQFGCWLVEARGYGNVLNVQGGIDAWSIEVDPSVPRY